MAAELIDTPEVLEPTFISVNSFTANWTHIIGADNYIIELSENEYNQINSENIILNENFYKIIQYSGQQTEWMDIEKDLDFFTFQSGWEGALVYSSSKGIIVGDTLGNKGFLSTPAIISNKGSITLSFTMASYMDTPSKCVVRLKFGNTIIRCDTITINSNYKDFVINYDVDNQSQYQITFLPLTCTCISSISVFDGTFTIDDIGRAFSGHSVPQQFTIIGEYNTSMDFSNLNKTEYKYRVLAVKGKSKSKWSFFQVVKLMANNIEKTINNNQELYIRIDGMQVSKLTQRGFYINRCNKGYRKIIY